MAHSRDYYKAKLDELKSRMTDVEQKQAFERTSKFYKGKLAHMMSDQELSGLGKQAQQRELKRQVEILSGQRERQFAMQWKRNMVEALEGIGANSKLIWDFKRNVKIDDIMTHYEEYRQMSDIFVPYSSGGGEEEATTYDQFLLDYQDWYNKHHKKTSANGNDVKALSAKDMEEMYGYRKTKQTEQRIIASSPKLTAKIRARQNKRKRKR